MKNMNFKISFVTLFLIFGASLNMSAQTPSDTFETPEGNLEVFHVGHASLYFSFNNKIIHVDPFGQMGDYTQLPKADLILITHEHGDHLDPETVEIISKSNTQIISSEVAAEDLPDAQIMKNGDQKVVMDLKIQAVPAYNVVHKRDNGQPYHPKGRGNGYVINFGNKRVYVAGDTENIPEMKELSNIDIAFLPMNLPYTMTPEMVKEAALMVKPTVLFPYHYKFGQTDTDKLTQLMENVSGIEVRFRQ